MEMPGLKFGLSSRAAMAADSNGLCPAMITELPLNGKKHEARAGKGTAETPEVDRGETGEECERRGDGGSVWRLQIVSTAEPRSV
jgi:hypothetical protein